MDKRHMELTRDLLDCFHMLPKDALPACIWACKNREYIFTSILEEPYTKEENDTHIQDCLERKDYVPLLLALFKKQQHEKR